MYVNSENLIHRLFVCIAGVADQLQTNYSADVRKVLKMVLQPVEVVPVYEVIFMWLMHLLAIIFTFIWKVLFGFCKKFNKNKTKLMIS